MDGCTCPMTASVGWQRCILSGETDQQFGRTRQRDRAGSTGRAGCSRAGEQLVGLFFIDALLVCGNLTHAREEQQRTDNLLLL